MKICQFLRAIALMVCVAQPAVSQQLKPGDVDPNAKVIDADNMYSFNRGAAAISKGNATALIDKEGNFIVAYNKYDIRIPGLLIASSLTNGLFFTNMGIINSKGKVLVDQKDWGGWGPMVSSNFMRSYNGPAKTISFMDQDTKKYVVNNMGSSDDEKLREGVVMIHNGSKVGYKTIKNEVICQPVYDAGEPFFDGMAMVAKTDAFGEMKYGFIDRTGKEVVPIIYSVKPDNFHAGLAKVTPKDKTEFEYAYIGKDGKIVIKFTRADVARYGMFFLFNNQLYANDKFIMDGNGKIVAHTDFLAQYGISLRPGIDKWVTIYPGTTSSWAFRDSYLYDDGKIRFMRILAKPQGVFGLVGFIDLATKNVVEATFAPNSSYSLYFDPVSRLAYAEVLNGYDAHAGYKFRKGYINEQGVFVIVKGEAAKW